MSLMRCRGFTMDFAPHTPEQGWTAMQIIGSPWGDACAKIAPPWAVKASTPHQACMRSKEMLDSLLEHCARSFKPKGFAGASRRSRRKRRGR